MPMFLHGGLVHLIMNLVSQLIIGSIIEKMLSLYQTSVIYFLSGLGGTLFGCLINNSISVGASGAIFGLCGAFVVYDMKC